MNKATLMFCAALAAITGSGATQVTPRQMTNYVEAVETRINARTDGLVAEAKQEAAEATEALEAKEDAAIAAVEVRQTAVEDSQVALSNFVASASPAGLSNYTARVEQELRTLTGDTASAMTNKVDEAKTAMGEAAKAMTNKTDAAVGRIDAAVAEVGESAKLVTNYYDTVKGELIGVSNFVQTVSPAGLSNFVFQTKQEIIDSVSGLVQSDDGVHADESGNIFVYASVKNSKGDPTVRKQYYAHSWDEEVGTNYCYKVVESQNRTFTNGMIFAVADIHFTEWWSGFSYERTLIPPPDAVLDFEDGEDKITVRDFNDQYAEDWDWDPDRMMLLPLKKTFVETNSSGDFWDYSTPYEVEATVEDGRCVTDEWRRGYPDLDYGFFLFSVEQQDDTGYRLKVTVTHGRYEREGGTGTPVYKPRGHFFLEAYKCFDDAWTNCTGALTRKHGSATPAVTMADVFTNRLVQCDADFWMTLTPTNNRPETLMAPAPNSRKFAPLKASGRPTSTNIKVWPDAPHGCEKVDSFLLYGYDPEDYSCDLTPWYKREDWENRENWIQVPQSVTVYVYDEFDDAWYPQPKYCRTVDAVLAAAADYPGTSLPPKPFRKPEFTELDDCDDNGHIWGKDCVCEVCEAKRSHEWGNADGGCDKCINHFTKKKRSKNAKGGYEPDGELDTMCLYECDDPALSHHRTWHHTGSGGEQENLFCSCSCGYYGNGGLALEHAYGEAGDTWTDSGDGANHYAEKQCDRQDDMGAICGHEYRVYEAHHIGEDSQRDYSQCSWHDSQQHTVKARCTANGCTYYGDLLEDHTRVEYGGEGCWCPHCRTRNHQYSSSGNECGRFKNSRCIYCGKEDPSSGSGGFGHDFNKAVEQNANEHSCKCGAIWHYHYYKNGVCCGGSERKGGSLEPDDTGCDKNEPRGGYHKCKHKKKGDGSKNTDQTHTESGEGHFGNNPGAGKSCGDCGAEVADDIPLSIRQGWSRLGFLVYDIPFCHSSADWTLTSTILPSISGSGHYSTRESGLPSMKLEAAFGIIDTLSGMQFESARDNNANYSVTYRLEVPSPDSYEQAKNIGFLEDINTGKGQSNLVYTTITYTGTLTKDADSGEVGVAWQ